MIWILLILGILMTMVFWLLLAPLELRIDTDKGLYRLGWMSIGSIRIMPEKDDLLLDTRILFWRRQVHLVEMIAKKRGVDQVSKKIEQKSRKKNQNLAKSFSYYWRKIRGVLSAVQIKEAYCMIDTDDFVLNAYLQPLLWAISRSHPNVGIYVNFVGKQVVRLHILSRPGAILVGLLR